MKFLKKKKIQEEKTESVKMDEGKILVDENEFIDLKEELQGYYNMLTLFESRGIIVNDKKDSVKIDLSLLDRIKLSLYGLFDYENLPSEIPSHTIEDFLFYGDAVFFEVAGKYYVGNYVVEGDRDVYNNPIHIYPIFKNGTQISKRKVDEDCVILRNTFTGLSTYQVIEPLIKRLVLNYDISLNNLKMSRVKKLFTTNDTKSLKNVKREIVNLLNNSGSVAFAHTQIGELDDFPLYEKFESSEYWEDFNSTFSLLWNILGINSNPNEDKKERLVVDEVNINEERVGLVLEAMFKTRQDFVEKINEIFGLNIKLKMYVNYKKKENDINDFEEDFN